MISCISRRCLKFVLPWLMLLILIKACEETSLISKLVRIRKTPKFHKMQFLVTLFHRLIIISPAHYLEAVCGEDIFNSWVVKCHIKRSRVPSQLDTESKEQDPKSLRHISSAPISDHIFLFCKCNVLEIYQEDIPEIWKSISIVSPWYVWKAEAKVQKVKGSFFCCCQFEKRLPRDFPKSRQAGQSIWWHKFDITIFCVYFNQVLADLYFSFLRLLCLTKLSLSGKIPDHHSSQCWFMLLLWFLQLFAARFWLPGENMTLKGWDWNCIRAGNEIFNGFTSLHSPGAQHCHTIQDKKHTERPNLLTSLSSKPIKLLWTTNPVKANNKGNPAIMLSFYTNQTTAN